MSPTPPRCRQRRHTTISSGGYNGGKADLLVRVDVTYLRQDFSLLLPVVDAAPWPGMQRYDFMVRTRTVSDNEAVLFHEKLA